MRALGLLMMICCAAAAVIWLVMQTEVSGQVWLWFIGLAGPLLAAGGFMLRQINRALARDDGDQREKKIRSL